jgi:hypothetical protein
MRCRPGHAAATIQDEGAEVSQSEEDILTALIYQHVDGRYKDRFGERQSCSVTESSARDAARKILSCGFPMASRPVDNRQDRELDALERSPSNSCAAGGACRLS